MAATDAHAVLVYVPLSDDEMGTEEEQERLMRLAERLEARLSRRFIGEFEGDEFGDGVCTLLFYTRDADRLFEWLIPELLEAGLPGNTRVVKRYGPPGAAQHELELSSRLV